MNSIPFEQTGPVPGKARVAVAMSGGVDSAVAAMLLKEQGFDLVGVTMTLLPEMSDAAANDAARVAAGLGIPHFLADLGACFQEQVVSPFAGEYELGRTPNPCARCNPLIKFGQLFDFASKKLGCTHLATGHYARLEVLPDRVRLLTARFRDKDQTYFLFGLGQEILARTIFPLGQVESKEQVRSLAEAAGLPVARKSDSQEICFTAGREHWVFLEQELGLVPRPGPITLTDGTLLGTHQGLHRYTVGQRKGLGIGWREPLHVLSIAPQTNTLVVGPRSMLETRGLHAGAAVWTGPRPELGDELEIKVRYRSPSVGCRITGISEQGFQVEFLAPVFGVSPGQVAVLYQGEELIGGGWIERGISAGELE